MQFDPIGPNLRTFTSVVDKAYFTDHATLNIVIYFPFIVGFNAIIYAVSHNVSRVTPWRAATDFHPVR